MRVLPQLPSPTGTLRVEAQTLDLGPVSGGGGPLPIKAESPCLKSNPWLLLASTSLAGIFCILYLTKPVVVSGTTAAPAQSVTQEKQAPVAHPATPLIPDSRSLPGETSRPQAADPRGLTSGDSNPFEETNLRVQHVMSAQGPAGEDLGRIVLDVPVLYRSRSLRWTPQEIARARQLMTGIANYQEKSRALREEGSHLLASWNELIGSSIPAETLRADSPTLPANQDSGRAEGGNQDTTHSIEIDR